MFLSLLAGGAIIGAQVTAPDTLVTGVSMFKNGYAVVVREANIGEDGTVTINEIPQSSLGTLWFTTTTGTKLEEVISSFREIKGTRDATSIDEILSANLNKKVRLGTQNGDAVTGKEIIGTIVATAGQVVVLKNGSDTLAVPKSMISSVASSEGELLYKMPTLGQERVLRIKTTGPKGGKVSMVSLERGITWAPGYAVDITNPDKLSIVAKATVLNDLAPLNNIEARFITGFPNVPFAGLPDPLTSGHTVDQFIGLINGIGSVQYGRPGGGGGRAGEMMSQNAAAPGGDAFMDAMPANMLPGQQEGELFFYRKPNVTLQKGDRAYYTLFKADAPYEIVYTWEMLDTAAEDGSYVPSHEEILDDVWQSVYFKNTSGQPFTTGAATTFKNGQIIGQDMLRYTSAGSEARLRITKSLDLRAERSEEEIARQRQALNLPNYGNYDLVTVKGTLILSNRKAEAVKIKITKRLVGELISSSEGAKVTKIAKGLRQVNSLVGLEWTKEVKPGEKLTLTYQYKLYVR